VLVGDLRRQAERVTRGVEKDHIPIWLRLELSSHGSQSFSFDHGLTKVINGKVEMHLFGHVTFGPNRLLVVINLDGRQPDTFGLDRNEVFAGESHFTPQERSPECGQGRGIGAIERDGTKANILHFFEVSWSLLPMMRPEEVSPSNMTANMNDAVVRARIYGWWPSKRRL
jgi:hypothetical protein